MQSEASPTKPAQLLGVKIGRWGTAPGAPLAHVQIRETEAGPALGHPSASGSDQPGTHTDSSRSTPLFERRLGEDLPEHHTSTHKVVV